MDSRKILLDYGERYNPKTNTVTINPGVNIRADAQGNVSSAGPGRVTLVTWMPGYRTVVIVDHGAGYRTVYANLASATVRRGSNVRRGEQIGKAGGPKGGRYLHFQVWKERQRMNPMTMLP
ncbi:MAG: membrane-bound metallopeptidase [Chlorobi bacterium OLB7]|nr:MAG: membrane-bound metallopeptidase [Chlorobi bacterium OLB7]